MKKIIHRIIRDGNHLILCDKNGDPIPKQIGLTIESNYGEPVKVTMTAYVDPLEIHDDVIKQYEYTITEK